jgi:acetyl esterase/lipase
MKSALRRLTWSILFSTLTLLAQAADAPNYSREEDIIYGRKFGTALTMDIFRPKETNGYAVLFMVSGGWFSAKEAINAKFLGKFLDRGYTVFAIVHGSQPRYIIPEVTQDIHRAVRYVRHHANKFGVRPDRFGISGASAGGHLSLTMGVHGKKGSQDAKDPVDRESSAVQAVACFFPPTDFLNYGTNGVDAVGVGILKNFKSAFGARADSEESRQAYGKEISPINFVTKDLPPTLIIHGDADKLVPYQQAEIFIKKATEAGVPAKLINRPGKDHGWADMVEDIAICADWFDQHLRGIKKSE